MAKIAFWRSPLEAASGTKSGKGLGGGVVSPLIGSFLTAQLIFSQFSSSQ